MNEMTKKSIKVRREKAAERRAKVAKLKEQGMSGPQIATELGESCGLSTKTLAYSKKNSRNPRTATQTKTLEYKHTHKQGKKCVIGQSEHFLSKRTYMRILYRVI